MKDKGMSKERAARIANSPNASHHGGKKSDSEETSSKAAPRHSTSLPDARPPRSCQIVLTQRAASPALRASWLACPCVLLGPISLMDVYSALVVSLATGVHLSGKALPRSWTARDLMLLGVATHKIARLISKDPSPGSPPLLTP